MYILRLVGKNKKWPLRKNKVIAILDTAML